MDKRLIAAVAALLVVGLGVGGFVWWRYRTPAPTMALPPPEVAINVPKAAPAPPPEPVIRHPIDAAPAASSPPASTALDAAALAGLLGQKAVLAFLQTDGFVQRLVGTVDNLGRPHAAPRLWPVNPAPGRFTVERTGDAESIAPSNARRYATFVQFVENVDSPRAAALYRRHYALFQQAYGDLGYPRGYFNDRLVEVIDHLLATPEPAGPVKVRLIEVKGPVPLTQPWVHYEFVDPGLEALSSGQKMLLRMGPENARRLKAKLADLRRLVASGAAR
jgi:hypothetical protein